VRLQWILVVLLIIGVSAVPAVADGLTCASVFGDCANPGQISAQSTGDITGSLVYFSADFSDYVRVIDTNPNNFWVSSWSLGNRFGTGQSPVTFGHALKNDTLVIQLCDQQEQQNFCNQDSKNQYLFASDPAYSADNKSHAVAARNGGGPFSVTGQGENPRTAVIWMEDLSDKQHTDWDYNDEVLNLGNVLVTFPHSGGLDAAPVPEPSTIVLLASGLAGGLIRRMKKN